MIKLTSRLIIGAVLLSTLGFGFPRVIGTLTETLPHSPVNGLTCVVDCVNYDIRPISPGYVTTIQIEPFIGGWSFGMSGLFVEPRGSNFPVQYDSFRRHFVGPNFPFNWARYTAAGPNMNAGYTTLPL